MTEVVEKAAFYSNEEAPIKDLEESKPLLAKYVPKVEKTVDDIPSSEKLKLDNTSCWDNVPVLSGINKLYEKYDATFLTMLGMQYFN